MQQKAVEGLHKPLEVLDVLSLLLIPMSVVNKPAVSRAAAERCVEFGGMTHAIT